MTDIKEEKSMNEKKHMKQTDYNFFLLLCELSSTVRGTGKDTTPVTRFAGSSLFERKVLDIVYDYNVDPPTHAQCFAYDGKRPEDPTNFTEKELSELLQDFKQELLDRNKTIHNSRKKLKLKHGDFVWNRTNGDNYNDGLCIYDSLQDKLLDLDGDENYGGLPSSFRVLEPHPEEGFIIPINYWHKYCTFDSSAESREHKKKQKKNKEKPILLEKSIVRAYRVHLDITSYGDEILRNVSKEKTIDRHCFDNCVFTYFTSKYDGEPVYILLEDELTDPEGLTEHLKDRSVITLIYESNIDCLCCDDGFKNTGRILML